MSTIDRIYIATNVSFNDNSNADRDLNRFEFCEILVRLANTKYKESGICSDLSTALKKLLDDNIFPNTEELYGKPFRDQYLYTNDVNDIFLRNEYGLSKLFGLFIHG